VSSAVSRISGNEAGCGLAIKDDPDRFHDGPTWGRTRPLYDTAEYVLLSKGALGLGFRVSFVSEPEEGIAEVGPVLLCEAQGCEEPRLGVPNGVVWREEVIADFRRIHDRHARAWELHEEIMREVCLSA
jgi:hypothetical protein